MDQAIAPDQGLPRAEPDLQPRSFDLIYVGPLRPALGGTQMVCTALLNRLAARGHRIRTITARSPEFGPEIIGRWLHPDIEATSIEMSHIDVLLGYRSEANPSGLERESYFRMQSQRVRTVLGPMISRRRPDLVVIGRESFIHGMPEFLRAQGIPGLLMTHGAAGAVVHGHYRDDLIRPLLESMAEIDGIVAVARHMGEGLEPLGLRHVAVIPNPVNVELFAPRTPDRDLRARLGITPDDVVVYHASNLKAVKRPLDLIRAVALAMRQNHTIRLIVVGDGPLGAEARIQCGVEGIEDCVRFEGWIDNEDLPVYLSLADMAVMCSETEGQPMAVLEAMACGCAIAATAIPAFEELVAAAGAGLLAPVGDAEAMAACILRLATDDALRDRLGKAGRAAALRDHDLSNVVVAYETAIAAVIDRARRRDGSMERTPTARS